MLAVRSALWMPGTLDTTMAAAPSALGAEPRLTQISGSIARWMAAAAATLEPGRDSVAPCVAEIIKQMFAGPFEYQTCTLLPQALQVLPAPLGNAIAPVEQQYCCQRAESAKVATKCYLRRPRHQTSVGSGRGQTGHINLHYAPAAASPAAGRRAGGGSVLFEAGGQTLGFRPVPVKGGAEARGIVRKLQGALRAKQQSHLYPANSVGAIGAAFASVLMFDLRTSFRDMLLQMREFFVSHGSRQGVQLTAAQIPDFTDPALPSALAPPVSRRARTIVRADRPPQLAACLQDSDKIVGVLKKKFLLRDNEIRKLRDDGVDAET